MSQIIIAGTLNLIYLLVLAIAAPWIVWSAIHHGKYREGFAAKLLGLAPKRTGDSPCIWLHAVSVGEVNLLATTIAELASREPGWEVVISTTTKTGYDLARRKYPDRTVFYAPLDFSWATAAAMRRVRPTLLVLAELELWPNLIRAAKRQAAAVAIINGRLSDKSYRGYRRVRWLAERVLRPIDVIAAQDAATAERFRQLGARGESVVVTGSLKFDGAQTHRDNPRTTELRRLAGIAPHDAVFLVGSTQAPEEEYAVTVFQRLSADFPDLRLIVVPRHPERFNEVAQLLAASGIPWQRRSELKSDVTSRDLTGRRPPVLLVDVIGELGAWWGAAKIGFVGGSFGTRGGQNMLEPAAYGVAACFGPNTWNFRDIVAQLLSADGAVVVDDAHELEAFVRRVLAAPRWGEALGERARQLVLKQQGATRRTVDLLLPLISRRQPSVRGRAA